MAAIDPVGILDKFIDSNNLKRGGSVEETVNAVLVHIKNSRLNVPGDTFRDELFSCCAVTLGGMAKIKDPVVLFRNLAGAFESRGWCIFTNTVKRAFFRLEADAVNRKMAEGLFFALSSVKNPYIYRNLSSKLPYEYLEELLGSDDREIRESAAKALALKRSTPLRTIQWMVMHQDSAISSGAAKGMRFRNDLPVDFMKALLQHPYYVVRENVAYSLAKRFKNTALAAELVKHPNLNVRYGAKQGLKKIAGTKTTLKYIKGSPKKRRLKIHSLTKPLVLHRG